MDVAVNTPAASSSVASGMVRRLARGLLNPRLLALLMLVVLWKIVSMNAPSRVVPDPLRVADVMWQVLSTGLFFQHLGISMLRIMSGFTGAVLVGIAVGVLMGSRRFWEGFFKDIVLIGMSLPGLIYAFLAVMWFGLSLLAPMLAILTSTYPFVAVNVFEGVRAVDKELLDMAHVFRVGRTSIVRRVIPRWRARDLRGSATLARVGTNDLADSLPLTRGGLGWGEYQSRPSSACVPLPNPPSPPRRGVEMSVTPIQTVHETIADRLRQAIIDGELRPGDRLVQDELATRYGVSRIPVREVLRTLAAEGLVTFHERHGVIVTELTAEDIEEIYSIRMSLEGMATRLAAQRITPEQLAELRQAMNELEAACGEPGHYFQLNYNFHAIILDAARRPRLKTMVTNLRNCAEPAARRYLDPAGRVGIAHEDHRALYEALASHNAEAAERLAAAHGEHIMRGILADMNGRASDATD